MMRYSKTGEELVTPSVELPQPRHEMLHRTKLLTADFLEAPALTVLNGGSGFGKSVLLMQQAQLARASGAHVVHVYMRPNESGIFDIYRRVRMNLEAQGIVKPGDMPDDVPSGAHDLAFTSLRHLDRRLVVLVDNVQESQGQHPSIARAFANVLESLPGMNAVLAGRELSFFRTDMHQLRVHTQIVEEHELAFSQDEIEEICIRAARDFSESEVRTCAEKLFSLTQGWPLAVAAVISQVSQAGNWTPSGIGGALSSFSARYFTEATSGLSVDEKRLLLILDAVPEASATLLAELGVNRSHLLGDNAANALITRKADQNGEEWFRLRIALGPRVSQWAQASLGEQEVRNTLTLLASALSEKQPHSAFRAALGIGDLEMANSIVRDSLADLLWTICQSDVLMLSRLPDAHLHRFPLLRMLCEVGSASMTRGRLLRMRGMLGELEKSLREDSIAVGMRGVTAAAARMRLMMLQGDTVRTREMIEFIDEQISVLTRSEAARGARSICAIEVQLAAAELRLLNFDVASERAQVAAKLASVSGFEEVVAHALALQALVAALQGNMLEAEALIAQFDVEHPALERLPSATFVNLGLARAISEMERGHLADAETAFQKLQHEELLPEHWMILIWFQAFAMEHTSGPEEALEWLGRRVQTAHPDIAANPVTRLYFSELIVRLQYKTDRLILSPGDERRDDFIGLDQARSSGNLERALTIATLVESEARKSGNIRRTVMALLAKAEVLRWRLNPAFNETWHKAKQMCERNGLTTPMHLFPNLLLLEKTEGQLSSVVPDNTGGIATLSQAELRALRQVAISGNAVAAARALYLSPHTVRAQLKSCYRKLKVANRSEALIVAARLGMLRTDDPRKHAETGAYLAKRAE